LALQRELHMHADVRAAPRHCIHGSNHRGFCAGHTAHTHHARRRCQHLHAPPIWRPPGTPSGRQALPLAGTQHGSCSEPPPGGTRIDCCRQVGDQTGRAAPSMDVGSSYIAVRLETGMGAPHGRSCFRDGWLGAGKGVSGPHQAPLLTATHIGTGFPKAKQVGFCLGTGIRHIKT
jgi:hypothetical protein